MKLGFSKHMAWVISFLASMLFSNIVHSHSTSTSYLNIVGSTDNYSGEWAVRLDELVHVFSDGEEVNGVPLDSDNNGAITWQELQSSYLTIVDYARSRIRPVNNSGEGLSGCSMQWSTPSLRKVQSDMFLALPFALDCDGSQLQADPLFGVDSSHRIIASWGDDAVSASLNDNRVTILSPQNTVFSFSSTEQGKAVFGEFLWQGVVHILIGFDHLLFLLALVTPILLIFSRRQQAPEKRLPFKPGLIWPITQLITAFTVGHSITLGLATLGEVTLPVAWVESAIALSVVVAGCNIIWPIFYHREWMVALAFGLIHGFGFANVLADLLLSVGSRAQALVSFNLGVEIGQLFVVMIAAPLLLWLGRKRLFNHVLRYTTGFASMLIGSVWVWQRLA